MFAYCNNNPVIRKDSSGEMGDLALAGGGMLMAGVSWSSIGSAVLGALGSITPIGWVAIGTVVVVNVVVGSVVYAKKHSKNNADPYARAGQKKQGRELKNKNRKKDNFVSKNNRRDGMPAPPKHHTPSKDHQKFSQSPKTKIDMLYKQIG